MNHIGEARFTSLLKGSLRSYSQVFFSDKVWFGILLLFTSFLDHYSGLAGLVSVLVANLVAELIGLNRYNISRGYYGFNALLTGLGLGIIFSPSWQFFFVLIFVALLVLMITIAFEGILGKYGLPYLSIPFLLGIWTAILATRHISTLQLSERGIYWLNQLYDLGGMRLVDAYLALDTLGIPLALQTYFKSLGAIFFQNYLLSGILVSVGLLFFSRIAFSLSLIGFFSAYFYYQLIGADIHELSYSFIGFNYILTAIAVGGFFLIPSIYSYLWTLLLIPLLSLMAISGQQILAAYNLPVLSFPFIVIVLLFLYILKFRYHSIDMPSLVANQQFSPERNLYSWQNYRERFGNAKGIALFLPFFGKWILTQSYDGEHTHKDQWRFAWDFEIADETGSCFKESGTQLSDYYCFAKPVAAPADGIIEVVQDGIEDNPVGKLNLEKNWGNTVVIRHAPDLFTKLSHLMYGSIRVGIGQPVKRGEVIANCGNTGRSAVPHLHMQVQITPHIGSSTIQYPPANYFLHRDDVPPEFIEWTSPQKGQQISNAVVDHFLENSFGFVPGQKLTFEVYTDNKAVTTARWDVIMDLYGLTYIQCKETGARAWFSLYNNIFRFTHFDGSKKSPLFMFYLAAYKQVLCCYSGLKVDDKLPANALSKGIVAWLHDFIAPFGQFIHGRYHVSCIESTGQMNEKRILLRGKIEKRSFGMSRRITDFMFSISSEGIEELTIEYCRKSMVLKQLR